MITFNYIITKNDGTQESFTAGHDLFDNGIWITCDTIFPNWKTCKCVKSKSVIYNNR